MFGFITNFLGKRERREARQRQTRSDRRRYSAIAAANVGKNKSDWMGMPSDEDAANKEYLTSLSTVIQRSQDLDVNNPDVGGFNRTRTAQILGKGVTFKHCPRANEIGMTADDAAHLGRQVNRLRDLHSRCGGFDSAGKGRSEGKQQERAVLTTIIAGSCLVHRVWVNDSRAILPFSIELISGKRISTPFKRMGDPRVSYGIEYTDDHRTRIVGFHVRRVSKTIGNNFTPDYEWDFLPVEDCSLLEITEMADLDRALPLCVRVVRMLRNRGEFIESSVEGARAQAKHYAVTEVAEGADPWALASDDADQPADPGNGMPTGVTHMGDGVNMLYAAHGEKVTWSASKLPDPDFTGFMDKTDERCARGLGSSLSRFTRKVNSSWAGGRLEDQQDDPIIDQLRESFVNAWQKVNEWFLEAIWLTDAIDLPGYSSKTREFWCEFRATFPGKLHINPSESMKARETAFMLRSQTPFQAAEEDGGDFHDNLRQWAEAMVLARKVEIEHKLDPHTLDILFSGKSITTDAGADIAPPAPEPTEAPNGNSAPKNGKKNGHRFAELIGGNHG